MEDVGYRASVERLRYVAINFFLIFHLWGIACWCAPVDSPLIPLCRNLLRPYFLWSGLFQSWDMFAPVPKGANTCLKAVLRYQDGSSRTWEFPRMDQMSFTDVKERYRKFADYLQGENTDELLPDAARFIARLNSPPGKTGQNSNSGRATFLHCSEAGRQVLTGAMGAAHPVWLWSAPRGLEVTLRSVRRAWDHFFFADQSPLPVALFRIIYGVLIIVTLSLLKGDWLNWYGAHAWVSRATALQLEPGIRINVFSVLPQTDGWIISVFWAALASATLLTAGLFTRLSSILVFIFLTSMQQRNLYITHGGDWFLRLGGFFLIFAPAGAALSMDRVIRVRAGRESQTIRPRSPWAQRMIQLQLSALYFFAFLIKVKGAPWLQGTALFYVYHLEEFKRFPVPAWFFQPLVLRFGSWFALALEFSLGLLIWIKEFRYPLLLMGVLFHLWLEYSLNIPLFQWDVLSAYVLFIDPADLNRIGERLKVRRAVCLWLTNKHIPRFE
jgi:hypothetical protein